LIAGGFDGSGTGGLASAELDDPNTGTFAIAGTMTSTRDGHTATLLGDGRVLIVGGQNADHYDPSAELYIPADLWQKAITAMNAAAGTDDLNFWQWAWYWQITPAFPGAPVGFGVLGSIDNVPGLIDKLVAASGLALSAKVAIRDSSLGQCSSNRERAVRNMLTQSQSRTH
jgi:hypothetical protein